MIELATGIHPDVDGVMAELAALRTRLAHELAAMGLSVAAAGTHPLTVREETEVSSAARYRALEASLRVLARREPTMALHVHVGVPAPEDAIRLLNGLRRNIPVLLALSANSPFWQGRDSGFASARTLIFQAFPRAGPPRLFADYADYAETIDPLIASGAIPDPSHLWWDVRLQPALGTVEVRVMDAQSQIRDVAPLVALIQALACLELEGEPSTFDAEPRGSRREPLPGRARRDGRPADRPGDTSSDSGAGDTRFAAGRLPGPCGQARVALARWIGCSASRRQTGPSGSARSSPAAGVSTTWS